MWKYEKPDNLVEWWIKSERKFNQNTLFWMHNNSGTLDKITYQDIGKRINHVRGGLAKLGINKNDGVGIICSNRPEWVVMAYSTYGRNARFIPMYEKELSNAWKFILKDGGVKFLLVSTQEIHDKIMQFKHEIPGLEHIYIIESKNDNSLEALEKLGDLNPVEPIIPTPDDIAVLIYTSGTTGDPKGVMLSHGNLTYCSRGGYKIYPMLNENHIALSVLPWAHSYGLSGELNNWIQFGGSIGFMRDVNTLAEDFQLIRPTYIVCVPKLFNKIFHGIQKKMITQGGLKLKLFQLACETAKKKRKLNEKGQVNLLINLQFAILDKLVFSKIRAAFGGRLKGSITGSAAMNIEIAEFFSDIGIPTHDCYGLSETSPAVTMNAPGALKLGSVGRVLEGQKVIIDQSVVEDGAKDGEIIVYGPNVMKGYQNKLEETAKVMTKDGGFRTGDRGRLDSDGFLWITGRIKEQYKLENGKYIFPAAIEEEIKLLPEIINAFVCGNGNAFNVCLVVPDYNIFAQWAAGRLISPMAENLMINKEFTDMISNKITEHLKKTFGGYEIPKKFLFLKDDFSIENGTLTQTLKLKRPVIMNQYKNQIEKLYSIE